MYLRSGVSGWFKTYWFSLRMYNKAVFASSLFSVCNRVTREQGNFYLIFLLNFL